MASQRRGIRRPATRGIACGPDDCAPRPATAPADPAAPARVVNLAGGTKWLATLVARLNSQDLETGASSTRLILRFESLTDPDRQPRIHSVCADSLEEMPAWESEPVPSTGTDADRDVARVALDAYRRG